MRVFRILSAFSADFFSKDIKKLHFIYGNAVFFAFEILQATFNLKNRTKHHLVTGSKIIDFRVFSLEILKINTTVIGFMT